MEPVCLAFKAHLGWINSVAVRSHSDAPVPVLVRRITLFDAMDREATEPYHVAGGWQGLEQGTRPPDPEDVIRRGCEKQAAAAIEHLSRLKAGLEDLSLDWRRGVMLTARGRLGDLEHVLRSHAHIHLAEGEAIRDATRAALTALEIPWVNQDEKSIPVIAAEQLCVTDCDALMRSVRPQGVASWRKEERLIALGAWLHRR